MLVKLGSMLIAPENENAKPSERTRGKEKETTEDEKEAAYLLTQQDPMDWVLKNEYVSNMMSVSCAKLLLG